MPLQCLTDLPSYDAGNFKRYTRGDEQNPMISAPRIPAPPRPNSIYANIKECPTEQQKIVTDPNPNSLISYINHRADKANNHSTNNLSSTTTSPSTSKSSQALSSSKKRKVTIDHNNMSDKNVSTPSSQRATKRVKRKN